MILYLARTSSIVVEDTSDLHFPDLVAACNGLGTLALLVAGRSCVRRYDVDPVAFVTATSISQSAPPLVLLQ